MVNPYLRPHVIFLTSAFTNLVLAFLLILLSIYLYREATARYHPVVHKVSIIQEKGSSHSRIEFNIALFNNVLEKFGGTQYFETQIYPSSLSGSMPPDSTDVYSYYGSYIYSSSSLSARDGHFDNDTTWNYERFGAPDTTIAKYRVIKTGNAEYKSEAYSTGELPHQIFSFIGDDLFTQPVSKNKWFKKFGHDNPYVAVYIKFEGLYLSDNGTGWITMNYGGYETKEQNTEDYDHPLQILTVYPEPTSVTPSTISYIEEDFKKALENGVYLIAEDITKKRAADNWSFMTSVFLGAILSWIIQLIATIFSKWRKAFEHPVKSKIGYPKF